MPSGEVPRSGLHSHLHRLQPEGAEQAEGSLGANEAEPSGRQQQPVVGEETSLFHRRHFEH